MKSGYNKILRILENTLNRMGIEIKYTRLYGKGGLCRIKDQWKCVINKNLTTEDKINTIVEGMKLLSIEDLYIPPLVRNLIEKGGLYGNIYFDDKTFS